MLARLPDETADSHLAFLQWLSTPPPRLAPNATLANAHHWTERANFFDAFAAPESDPAEQLRHAARVEVARLHARVLGGAPGTPTLTMKELGELLAICAKVPPLEATKGTPAQGPGAVDVAKLTTEEIAALAKVAARVEQEREPEDE